MFPTMMYAGKVAWDGAGTRTHETVTSREAIELGGLNWAVEKRPIYDANGEEISGWFTTSRADNGMTLGVVGSRYEPIQNTDQFDFLDSLIEDRVLGIHTVGHFRNGRTVWILAKMEEDYRILDDQFEQFLLLATGHDGWRSLSLYTTPVRVICGNTFAMATRGNAIARIRHSGNVEEKMSRARYVLQITTAEQRRMHEWLSKLSETEITQKTVTKIQEKIFGPLDEATPTRRRSAIEQFMAIYNEERDRVGQTAYAVANAITGYADHKSTIRKDSNRLESIMDGNAAVFKATGFEILQTATKVAMPKLVAI